MREIKFSHVYFKMPSGYKTSTLLQVIPIHRDNISDALYSYDTAYGVDFNEVQYYQLPRGMLLMLLLKSEHGLLWTTIRPYSKEKEIYYTKLCGEKFNIIILD